MAQFTTQQWVDKMNRNLAKLTTQKQQYQELAFEAVRKAEKRIFDQGKDKSGGDIGTYSNKEIYINPNSPNNPKKFTPKGKNSSSPTFKNGKARKTGFFKSYSAYKSKIDRGGLGNKVNLQLSKAFRRGFLTRSFPVTSNQGVMIVSIGVKATGVNSIGKLQGLMVDKYPDAFGFTAEEKAFILAELRKIFLRDMRA